MKFLAGVFICKFEKRNMACETLARAIIIAAVDEGERAAALAAALEEWQHVLTDLELRCGDGTGIIVSCMTRTGVPHRVRMAACENHMNSTDLPVAPSS
jgi:hypothetical protein